MRANGRAGKTPARSGSRSPTSSFCGADTRREFETTGDTKEGGGLEHEPHDSDNEVL
jgi:hypothetical protein